jgi:hypothetical protein
MDRWNWDAVITEDAKAYLQENMTYHPYKYHMYLFIYSWGYEWLSGSRKIFSYNYFWNYKYGKNYGGIDTDENPISRIGREH